MKRAQKPITNVFFRHKKTANQLPQRIPMGHSHFVKKNFFLNSHHTSLPKRFTHNTSNHFQQSLVQTSAFQQIPTPKRIFSNPAIRSFSFSLKSHLPPNPDISAPQKPSTALWSTRIQSLPSSTVWQIFTPLAQKHEAVNLGQGFPDFPAPKFVLENTKKAIANDFNQYSRVQGHPRLVNALSKFFSPKMEREIDPLGEIQTTIGATEGLFACAQAFISPGDEVILIEPVYDAYPCDILLAGGVPRYTSTQWNTETNEWEIDFDDLEKLVNKKTKMIWINNPQNVSGKVYRRDELERIANIAKQNNLIVLSDEVYSQLHYDQTQHIPIASLPGMWERTLTLGSAGKSFAVTGFKIGWVFGSASLLKAVEMAHVNIPFCTTTPLQEGIAESFEQCLPGAEYESYFEDMRQDFTEKRNRISSILGKAGLAPLSPIQGSYFALTDFSHFPESLYHNPELDEPKDFHFARFLTEQIGVTPIPASAFWSPEHKSIGEKYVRWAFCKRSPTTDLAEQRLTKLLQKVSL